MHPLSLTLATFATLVLSIILASTPVQAAHLGEKWEATSFCKCICFGSNYTILHLVTPDNPSKPCLSCTKQWCINQNLPICQGATLGDTDPDTATGKEGDVEARCFQRDSPRDQLVVTLFLLTIFGLLLGAGIKGKMVKAGIDFSVPWTSGRRWWETWNPRLPFERINLGVHSPFSRRSEDDERRRGEYEHIENNDL
ncbi:uncharacterized protein FOMMEDRAFT_167215 [Fomitiporia mediterranea MF3/22]|uniref:uncharacterized protein n=1 Tax=Fomitiporia mediterranea (strain MF3/22) TaxID=694068 RepID=UPI00044078E1|nr:uncharacterized protein FOMMEDRAFT_167215 [Fomitiporia mediterranea MF3/22]EJD03910.1 hypothetical protein FOMMEDRAFT_167215 [Fomitiporia mediterranea MF3/22]